MQGPGGLMGRPWLCDPDQAGRPSLLPTWGDDVHTSVCIDRVPQTQPCPTGKKVTPRSRRAIPEAANCDKDGGLGELPLASGSSEEGTVPTPLQCPGEGTDPKACLGVSEHIAAPAGASVAPKPQIHSPGVTDGALMPGKHTAGLQMVN